MADKSEGEKNRLIVLGHVIMHYVLHVVRRDKVDPNAFAHFVKVISIGTGLPREEVRGIIEEALTPFVSGG